MASWPEGSDRPVAEPIEPSEPASITSSRPLSVLKATSVLPSPLKSPATIESGPSFSRRQAGAYVADLTTVAACGVGRCTGGRQISYWSIGSALSPSTSFKTSVQKFFRRAGFPFSVLVGTDDFIATRRAHRAPGPYADRVLDEADGIVGHGDVDASVVAAACPEIFGSAVVALVHGGLGG